MMTNRISKESLIKYKPFWQNVQLRGVMDRCLEFYTQYSTKYCILRYSIKLSGSGVFLGPK